MSEQAPVIVPWDIHEPRFSVAQIQTQSHCNADCIMCPYGETSRVLEQGIMDWRLYTKIIDDVVEYPALKSITLMLQNEPLLNTRLCDEIRYVKKKRPDLNVALASNGFLLDRRRVDELIEAGLGELIFSINALTRETFEVVEKGIDFDVVMANLRSLIDYNPRGLQFLLKFLILRENELELAAPDRFSDVISLARSRNIPIIIKPISNRAGSLRDYGKMVSHEQWQDSRGKTYCGDVFESVNVLYNGDVITCCADWLRRSVIGNLRNSTLAEVWNSEEARARRVAILEGRYKEIEPCRTCNQAWNILEYRKQCSG